MTEWLRGFVVGGLLGYLVGGFITAAVIMAAELKARRSTRKWDL